jgi:hydrogenase/urease accessory protein HupE
MSAGRLARIAAAVLLLSVARVPVASAHEFQPCVLDVRALDGGRYEITWKAAAGAPEAAAARAPSPVFPAHCHREEPPDPALAGDSPTRWTLACGPPGLAGQRVSVEGLSPGVTDALVRFTATDGSAISAVLRADSPSLVLPGAGPGARPRLGIASTYFGAGVEHLLGGWDHLLFILGLVLLVKRPRALLGTVTAFTAAHSVSLALAVTGVVRAPPAPAEAAIALSLLLLAGELARGADPAAPTLTRRRPWLMAFAFGLVHGLGFAGGLRALGLPAGQVPLALLMWNLGVEAGQLALVLVALGLLRLLGRMAPPATRLVAYGIGSLASFWCLERLASFWTLE